MNSERESAQYYDIIIIGGGASGLMLAASLDLEGRTGIILEKTGRLGTKLAMSGGGRCNITHGGSIKDFIHAYGDAGPRIRKCLYRHNNLELASWLEQHGVSLADEKGNRIVPGMVNRAERIFPASMKAKDILETLFAAARSNGWEIRTDAEVYDIHPSGQAGEGYTARVIERISSLARQDRQEQSGMPRWKVCFTPSEELTAESVVIATGGITFPETGSDGSAFDIMRSMGVTVTPLKPALAPVYVRDYPYEELAGVSLTGVTVTAEYPDEEGKITSHSMSGDILFTHRGFSGPVVLNISRYAEPDGMLRISYNREFGELPRRMQRILEDRARGTSGDIKTTVLASLLERDSFIIEEVSGDGMVTSGGISLDETDLASMQISGRPGLYAIGEAIDVCGITGGYNLQMCWSTAGTAADSLRKDDKTTAK